MAERVMMVYNFEAFVDHLRQKLGIRSDAPLSYESQLSAELALDSLQLLLALVEIEQMGSRLDDEVLSRITTLGELYDLYVAGLTFE